MNFRTAVIGGEATSKRFALGAILVGPKVTAAVRMYGMLLQTKVKARASGRPGPNAPTGDYRRSIALDFRNTGVLTEATVGTNKPQGRRLEFGFIGTDSLGRHYHQRPYPHFGPAVREIEKPFKEAVLAAAQTI